MENNISLKSLIDAVKKDLSFTSQDDSNPVFFVEKVEIEIAVRVTQEGKGGVNIQVLNLAIGESNETVNRIKISLSPILNRDEQRERLMRDPETWIQIKRDSEKILEKGGGDLLGEPE